MKILHIPNYYNPHIGGIEKTTEDFINALPESYEQKVICFKDAKTTVVETVDGVEVTRVGCQMKVYSQSIALGYKKELDRLFKEFNPDIVVFHYPNPFVATYLKKHLKKKKFKFILYWHLDIIKQKLLGKLFNAQTNYLLKTADVIVSTSENYVRGSKFLTAHKDKVKVIPSCVNDERFVVNEKIREKAEAIREDNKNKNIVFTCGRHVEYKGLRYLLDSAKLLSNDYIVYIGGQGPLTDSLKKKAKGMTNVKFLGKLSDDDLKSYLMASDIYAFPSITKNEAFGIALAEALGFGKPSVTFTIPGSGVNFVSLNNETGIEVANKDSNAFAAAIEKIAKNEELKNKFSENAKNRFKDNFSFELFKNNINSLIDDVSKENE